MVGILPKEPNTEEGEASLENRIGAAAVVVQVSPTPTEIRLIECNAKCRYQKKFTCNGTFRLVFYLSEAPFAPMTP